MKKDLHLKTLKEDNFPKNSFMNNKEKMITILKDLKTPLNIFNDNKETLNNLNKNKYNSFNKFTFKINKI